MMIFKMKKIKSKVNNSFSNNKINKKKYNNNKLLKKTTNISQLKDHYQMNKS